MEINNNSYISQMGVYKKQADQVDSSASPVKAKKSTSQTSASKGDTVSFSGDAFLLNEAHSVANSSSDIRQDKVDAIKAKLADGSYEIDSKKIAGKILSEERSLF